MQASQANELGVPCFGTQPTRSPPRSGSRAPVSSLLLLMYIVVAGWERGTEEAIAMLRRFRQGPHRLISSCSGIDSDARRLLASTAAL